MLLGAPDGGFPRLFSPGKGPGKTLGEGFPTRTIRGRVLPRRILACAIDPADRTLYLATKFTLHRRDGAVWTAVPLSGVNPYATITAVLADRGRLWIGTGCYGVYRLSGGRWQQLAAGLPGEGSPPRRQFYETVTALALGEDGTLYAGLHFGGGVWRLPAGATAWRAVATAPVARVAALHPAAGSVAVHDGSRWLDAGVPLPSVAGSFAFLKGKTVVAFSRDSVPATGIRHQQVREMRGLYFNPGRARPEVLAHYIRRMKPKGYNALVIDVKDDFGRVLYAGKVPLAVAARAYVPLLRISQIVDLCKKEGIHLVARMVTFKDPKLWAHQGGKYAVRDLHTGGFWNPAGTERWVNPFSPVVRSYNIDLAREVLALGFNEVQFDYIRFPTDGPVARAHYPGQEAGAWKIDAIENFLAEARGRIPGPVSVDIYGFNAWYALGAWMGQDISMIAGYVDAISPMHYPSHFDRDFRAEEGIARQPFNILKFGTLRPRILTGGRTEIRSWIQAFSWRAPGYGPGYWEQQIKGIIAGGGNGYLLWDAASGYPLLDRVRSFAALKTQ